MSAAGAARDLEDAIRVTLRERADAFRPSRAASWAIRFRGTFEPVREPRRHRAAKAAAFALAAAAVVGGVVWATSGPTSSSRVTTPAAELPGEQLPGGPTDAGKEITVQVVPTPTPVANAIRPFVLTKQGVLPESSVALALQPDDQAPVTITTDTKGELSVTCIGAGSPPFDDTLGGLTAACSQGGADVNASSVFRFGKTGAAGAAVIYYAWMNLPAGTEYVTIDSDTAHAWERPAKDTAVFPIEPATETAATLRAYDADGKLLATAPVSH